MKLDLYRNQINNKIIEIINVNNDNVNPKYIKTHFMLK